MDVVAVFGKESRRRRRRLQSETEMRERLLEEALSEDGRTDGHQLEMQPKYERCVAGRQAGRQAGRSPRVRRRI